MMEGVSLYAQLINHGQSEIWLGAEGRELTSRPTSATNEVLNITRRHCAPEAFEKFYTDYHRAIGQPAILTVASLDEVVAELRMKS
jgi:hypothetical protein